MYGTLRERVILVFDRFIWMYLKIHAQCIFFKNEIIIAYTAAYLHGRGSAYCIPFLRTHTFLKTLPSFCFEPWYFPFTDGYSVLCFETNISNDVLIDQTWIIIFYFLIEMISFVCLGRNTSVFNIERVTVKRAIFINSVKIYDFHLK